MSSEIRYAMIMTCNGKVVNRSGWDATEINTGMDETEALNKLGKLGYRPYKVTDHVGLKGLGTVEPVYTTFRLANQPLPQV